MNNMKRLIYLMTTFLLLLFLNSYYASGIMENSDLQKFKITAIADTKKIPLNKKFQVIVTVSYIGKPGDYIITEPYIEKYHNLDLIGNSTETSVKTSSEASNKKKIIKKYVFILKPQSLGQAYFPIVRITVSDSKGNLLTKLTTQAIPITVTEPVVEKEYSFLYLTVIIIVLILFGAFLVFNYLNKLKKKKEDEKKKKELKIQKSPEDEFFQEIKNVEKLKDIEKLSLSISILKKYFQKKFHSNFKDKSTDEIIHYFEKNKLFTRDMINQLEAILKNSDLIKFASEKNPKKIEEILNNIITLINNLKGGTINE